jgi:hypothetical protein
MNQMSSSSSNDQKIPVAEVVEEDFIVGIPIEENKKSSDNKSTTKAVIERKKIFFQECEKDPKQWNEALLVKGSIRAEGDLYGQSLYAMSDARYKKNITPLQNSLNQVKQIQGVSYNWNNELLPNKNPEDMSTGFIAQHLEKIGLEHLVHIEGGIDGMKSVDYIQVIPFLVEAIKELSNKVDMLSNRIL